MSATETRHQILDAAERLFADQGFDATSLRAITAAASVNLAAAHYHFHSKEGLIFEVLFRRLEGVNARRLELLDECERGAFEGIPSLECVIRAFIEPAFELQRDPASQAFMRLLGAALSHPADYAVRMFQERFAGFIQRFQRAFERALPGLTPDQVHWSFHFMVGAMAHTLAHAHKIELLSGGKVKAGDPSRAREGLVAFIAGGMRGMLRDGGSLHREVS